MTFSFNPFAKLEQNFKFVSSISPKLLNLNKDYPSKKVVQESWSNLLIIDISLKGNIIFNKKYFFKYSGNYRKFCYKSNSEIMKLESLYQNGPTRYRSSCPEVFCKKSVYRNFAKFTGKHLYQSLFFNKVARLRTATLHKRDSDTVFLWILRNF